MIAPRFQLNLTTFAILCIIIVRCTLQRLLETVRQVTTMQSRSLNINIVPPILQVHQGYGVRVAAACRVSLCSLLSHIINYKLTMLSAWLMPPPPLNIK